MKIILFLLLAMSLVTCIANTDIFAATSDRTATIAASGSITGTTSLSLAPTAVTYGTTNVDAYPTVPADKKVLITFGSNYNPWTIRIYTNNTAIPVSGTHSTVPGYTDMVIGRLAKGGLISTAMPSGLRNVVPCKWVAKVGTNVTIPAVPTYTAPGVYGPNFVKDIRDEDDPATTLPDPSGNIPYEDWTRSAAAGYANIAFGGPAGGFCVDPTKRVLNHENEGDPVTSATGVALYIAAGWGTAFMSPSLPAAAGSYSTTFVVDLLHE